jgi:hypothetical protein
MKDELRSESQAEICGGRKIRKSPLFCPACLSAILPLGTLAAPTCPAKAVEAKAGLPRYSRCGDGGSQCVAVSRSDKIIKRAGRHRPFFLSALDLASADASLHPRACVSFPIIGVEKSKPVKLGQGESNPLLSS